MTFARLIRRKLRAAVAPVVFLLLIAYFVSNAMQGDHGLQSAPLRQAELRQAQAEQARAEAEAVAWERRVSGLQNRLDIDSLDERVRARLNLSDPADVIVPYEKGQRLF